MLEFKVGAALPSAENTDGTSNFIVATNYRIELSLLGKGSEIDSIFLQGIKSLLSSFRFNSSVSSSLFNRGLELSGSDAVFFQDTFY